MDDLISRKRLLRDIYFQEGRYPETPLMRMAIREQPRVDAVVLPCKIGDTVWAIRSFHGKKYPQKGIVSEMLFLKNMELQIVVKYVARGPWGKTVFATKEEAENAIGGNQN